MTKFVFKPPFVPVYVDPLKTNEPNPPVLQKPTTDIIKKRPAKFSGSF
jgi:hypothetical protein